MMVSAPRAAFQAVAEAVAFQRIGVGGADQVFDGDQLVAVGIARARLHGQRQIDRDTGGRAGIARRIVAAAAVQAIRAGAAAQRVVAVVAGQRVDAVAAIQAVIAAAARDGVVAVAAGGGEGA